MTLRRWVAVAVVAVGLAALALAAPVGYVTVASWGRVRHLEEAPQAPVTVVLGAGLTPDGRPSPFLAARLDVAVRLLQQGRTRVLLVSGSRRPPAYDETVAMERYLHEHGVPADRVVRDPEGHTTLASCVRARRVYGLSRALVVSQGYHLPRSVALCRAVGVDAVGVGDWTAGEDFPSVWHAGVIREVGADAKAALDLLARRRPGAGRPDPSVQDALAHLH